MSVRNNENDNNKRSMEAENGTSDNEEPALKIAKISKENADNVKSERIEEHYDGHTDRPIHEPKVEITCASSERGYDSSVCEDEDIFELGKVHKSTNTEGEFVTDLEKLLIGFNSDYQNLEIEEYKKMLQKFYTQNLRLATRCQKLKAAVEKNTTTTTRILREASKQVNPHQLAFISAQLINNGKLPNKRVWSPQMKNLMVGLFRISPNAFRFLSKVLALPQEDEVSQWISQGTECDIESDEVTTEDGTTESLSSIEAQSVLDEIAFENLMATLL